MENNEPGIDMLLCNMSRKNIARPSLLVVVIYSFHTVCGDFSGGEEVIRSWKEDGSLVLLGFPLSDYSLHRGGGWITNQRPVRPAESQECRSCWVACCVISCLRGLLVVVTWSAPSPKITSVPAGDGSVKLVGHHCSLPYFLPQRMLRGWSRGSKLVVQSAAGKALTRPLDLCWTGDTFQRPQSMPLTVISNTATNLIFADAAFVTLNVIWQSFKKEKKDGKLKSAQAL